MSVLELLEELQSLDQVPRMGYALRGIADPESVSEHMFHVLFLVWALGKNVPGLDRLKALEIAMVHDLAEVRFGDLPRPAARYLPSGAKDEAENRALRDLLEPLGGDEAALLVEYQQRETLEARFVAVCDKLQILIKADVYLRRGSLGAGEFLEKLDAFEAGGFDPVAEVVRELRARRDERP